MNMIMIVEIYNIFNQNICKKLYLKYISSFHQKLDVSFKNL